MKVIYIAGPYRSKRGEYYVRQNIRAAEELAIFVWRNGGVALCPHKNTAGFGGACAGGDEVWLDGDLELIKRCDAMYLVPGWENSSGTLAEIQFAHTLGMPVFENREQVLEFLGVPVRDSEILYFDDNARNDWP